MPFKSKFGTNYNCDADDEYCKWKNANTDCDKFALTCAWDKLSDDDKSKVQQQVGILLVVVIVAAVGGGMLFSVKTADSIKIAMLLDIVLVVTLFNMYYGAGLLLLILIAAFVKSRKKSG